ncbi:hypothetical protein MNBD_GAMMA16-848 [hydrothermal vent metagenome]|uniref:Transposase IS4-like domain-containing protein n=1 Tax=hydrothermal vent metagenome TaxID=652676 RepID=A0A3B0ZJ51_9ZZZZ
MTYRTKIEILAEQILEKLPSVGAWQRNFLLHLFVLWLSIRGRHNFINLARYGNYTEYTFRKHFDKAFDFLAFNRHLVMQYTSADRIIAFDPSFLPKSGKHTVGRGYYWSGCAGKELLGLEISGISAVDLKDKTALHLEAIQTIKDKTQTLLDYYSDIIVSRSKELLPISKYLVADAYFSRNPFVDKVVEVGFEFTSRLRKNTYMRYLYNGPKKKGRGRPTKFDGKINPMELRTDIFTPCAQADDGSWLAYEAVVNVRAWKRNVKVVIIHDLDAVSGKIKGYRIYGCTDIQMNGGEVIHMYQSRFQQEFIFRDTKQEAGLEHCQARSWKKIHFHVNMALTVVSLAKVAHHLDLPQEQRNAFSIADIKTQYVNQYNVKRIFSTCGFSLHDRNIKKLWTKLTNFGKRAA